MHSELLKIKPQEWEDAKAFFNKNPQEIKFRKAKKLAYTHSFFYIDNTLYAVKNTKHHYPEPDAGAGGFSRVKFAIDQNNNRFAIKAEYPDPWLVKYVSMPGIGGLVAPERLRARQPDSRVLMLSAHDDAQIPSRALKLGATGYLSKRAEPTELVRAVASVARGQRYLGPELAPRLALAQLGGASDPVSSLTEKEFAVFIQLARGRSVA